MASFSSEHQARTCSRRCLSRVTCAWRWPGIPLGKAGAGVAPLEPSPPLRSPGPARAALACGELAAEPGEAARGYEQQFVFCRLPGSAQSCSAARDVLSGSTWLLSPGPVGWLALPHRPWLLLRGRSDPWLQVRGVFLGPFLPRSCRGISTEPELLCQASRGCRSLPVTAGITLLSLPLGAAVRARLLNTQRGVSRVVPCQTCASPRPTLPVPGCMA